MKAKGPVGAQFDPMVCDDPPERLEHDSCPDMPQVPILG